MASKEPFLGLSARQLVAGALAAMTSAWIASAIGVSGTIVGAAVGSFSASVATAFYLTGMTRGQTIVTPGGSVVSGTADTTANQSTPDDDVAEPTTAISTSTRARKVRNIIVRTVLALAIALAAIGAWELVSGEPFGQAERPAIGRPWQAPATSTPSDGPEVEPSEDTPPTSATPTPTTPSPEPEPMPEPTETVPVEPGTSEPAPAE